MSQYWITGRDIWNRDAELIVAEPGPIEAERAALERFGFLKLDRCELLRSEMCNDLPEEGC
jgi:hypothetical protein